MQKLREDYDLAKEKRKQEKAMQMGIASDLAGIQSGTPAQYAPTRFEQTPQRGQMPQGMTGVMMREQGQQMPQPQAFGEEILNGDFRLGGGEVTQEAVAGREPVPIDFLKSALKQSMLNRDYDNAFKFQKAIQESEKTTNEYYGGLTEGIDPKTGQPVLLAMTKKGAVPSGYAPKVKEKEAKAPVTWETKDNRIITQYGYDPKGNVIVLGRSSMDAPITQKPDPVTSALTLFERKEDIKAQNELKKSYREKYANASDAIPLLDNYIAALKNSPTSGFKRDLQSNLGYFGGGDAKQQAAMATAEQAGESLLTFAVKQPGPSTDRDVMSYRAQMGVIQDPKASAKSKIAAAEQAKIYVQNIHKKYGSYLGDILSGKINPEDIAAKEVSNDPYAITKDTDPRRAKYLLNHKALVDAKDYEGAKLLTELYKKGAK